MLRKIIDQWRHWRLERIREEIEETRYLCSHIPDGPLWNKAAGWLKRANQRKQKLEKQLNIVA